MKAPPLSLPPLRLHYSSNVSTKLSLAARGSEYECGSEMRNGFIETAAGSGTEETGRSQSEPAKSEPPETRRRLSFPNLLTEAETFFAKKFFEYFDF